MAVLWLLLILFSVLPLELSGIVRIAFVVLLLIHCSELPISIQIAKKNRVPIRTAVLKTLVFGFTWWLPLRKGVISQ